MRKLLRVALGALAAVLLASAGVADAGGLTAGDIDAVAQKLVDRCNLRLSGSVIVDPHGAGGFAAIRYQGTDARISVDPRMLSEASLNTWAFVIGHELGHHALQHGPTSPRPQAEWDADIWGAELAVKAGFDARSYVDWILSRPDQSSPEHGSWHARARNLAKRLGLAASARPDDPAPNRPPLETRVPCSHAAHPFDVIPQVFQMHAFDVDFHGRRWPCAHAGTTLVQVQCTHAAHLFDVVQR